MSEWDSFIHQGKLDEELFAQRHLSDIKWANNDQNIHEHWDMEGSINGKTSKFDVKGMKRKNRNDKKTQDEWPGLKGPTSTVESWLGQGTARTILSLNAVNTGSW